MKDINNLLSKPLTSTRTGAFYNTFPYPTKISPEAIAVYIACLTKPGETVLDAFGGSGSTAIAALLCQYPTDHMREIADNLNVSPVWGIRNAVLYEIGTYGAFAAKTLTSKIKSDDFSRAVSSFVRRAESELNYLYTVEDEDGAEGTLRYAIWSEMLLCPKCGKEISYFDYGTTRDPVSFKKIIDCPHCGKTIEVESCQSATETVYDTLLKKNITRKKRTLAWIYGETGKTKWNRAPNVKDAELIRKIESLPYEINDTPREIQWGELHRAGYHMGISHLHHFYTKRNYLAMSHLWELTEEYPEGIKEALQLLLLSYNATHCTLMTRVVAKKNAKDFVLTGAQSGVLYVSKLPVEKNILLGLKRKSKPFVEAYRLLENCDGRVTVRNQTSEQMIENHSSIDFVFTDPPFGDFIPYAEVNQINELWLKNITDRSKEIIISPSQHKEISDYQLMLTNVFSEINRVLKPEHYAVAVFHAAKAKVWKAFENAIDAAGLAVCRTSILDKKQASFKQVVSEDSVQGDPLVLLRSDTKSKKVIVKDYQLLKDIVHSMEIQMGIDERRVYSLYINKCLEHGQTVSLDAKEVYVYVRNLVGGINNNNHE